MKNIVIAAVLALLVVAVDGAVAQNADDAIKQTFVQMDRCVAENYAACAGALMADDATYLVPTLGTIVKGKTQIIEAVEKVMGGAAAGEKRPKQTHVVESVRMIDAEHAFVDASVATAGHDAGEGAVPQKYHFVALMKLEAGKWLFQDVRIYVMEDADAKKGEPKNG